MSLNVLERPTTASEPPASLPHSHRGRSPVVLVNPYFRGFDFGARCVACAAASTTAGADVVYADAGTLSDPICRLDGTTKRTSAQDVLEIKFLSGLTWDELGELFHVSRRAVHHWANGERLRPENALLVQGVLHFIRRLRRESSAENHLALLTPTALGRPLDLLKGARWGDAVAAMRSISALHVPPSPHPDSALLHPTAYFDSRTDMPGPTSGSLVRGRSKRIPRRQPR